MIDNSPQKRGETFPQYFIRSGGCSWHRPSDLDYLGAHTDAAKRIARGEKQRRCPDCKRCLWPDEFGAKP